MSSGGKGGGGGTTYDYYGTLAGGVCLGPVDALVSIILNGKEVWPGGVPWVVGANYTAGSSLVVFNGQSWLCQTNHTASDANAPGSSATYWLEYVFSRGSADYNDFTIVDDTNVTYGVLRLYWGTQTQTVDPLLTSAGNTLGDQHPDYKGICYVILRDFLLGQEIQSGPNVEIIVRKPPTQTVVTGTPGTIQDGQCNVAAVAAQILTDPNLIGQANAVIDATSFNAVATLLNASQLLTGCSVLLDTNDSLRSVFGKLTEMIDGFSRFNPTTKLIELGVFQHGVTPTTFTTLTQDSLVSPPKFSTNSWQETKSRATVNYPSRQFNYQQVSDKADDSRLFTILGQVREQMVERPYVCRPDQAVLQGRETLRVIGHAVTTCEVSVRRELARTCQAGSYVLLDIDIEPNANSFYGFFRVLERKIPATGPMTLKLVAENTLAPIPYNSGAAQTLVQGQSAPAATNYRVAEVPTILGGQRGSVVTLVQRPSSLVSGCQVYFDTSSGGTFPLLGSFRGFAARGKIGANVSSTASSINVVIDPAQPDANFFTFQQSTLEQLNDTMLCFLIQPVPGGGAGYTQIAETSSAAIMEICSVSSTSLVSSGIYALSILRGRQGTSPSAFTFDGTAGDEIEVWLIPKANVTAFWNSQFDTLRALRAAGTVTPGLFKFSPYTYMSVYPVSAAASVPFDFPAESNTAPVFNLTSPAWSNTVTGITSWPYLARVQGNWNDPDGNLINVTTYLVTPSGSHVLLSNRTFAPTFSFGYDQTLKLDTPGSYTLKIYGRDATNQTVERDIAFTLSGSGTQAVAYPHIFDANGDELNNPTGPSPVLLNPGIIGSVVVGITVKRLVPYGVLRLVCTTPGATIQFQTSGPILLNGTTISYNVATQTYIPNVCEPLYAPQSAGNAGTGVAVTKNYVVNIGATAAGYSTLIPSNFILSIPTVL